MKKFCASNLFYVLWAMVSAAFILLKAFGAMACSWIWALAPIWVPLVIAFIGSVIIFGICVVSSYRKK